MSPRKSTSEVLEILAARGLKLAPGCEYQGMHAPLTVIDVLGRTRTTSRAQGFVAPNRPLPKSHLLRAQITPERAVAAAEARGWKMESHGQWKGGRTPVTLTCAQGIHHEDPYTWDTSALKLVHESTSCAMCKAARKRPATRLKGFTQKGVIMEPLMRAGLAWITGHAFHATRPGFLRSSTGARLSLDAWSPTLRLAAEFQGRQHFAWIPFFHSREEDFLRAQACDAEKEAALRELGIPLISVPYFAVKVETMDAYLRQELAKVRPDLPLNPIPIPIHDPEGLGLDQAMLDDSRVREAAAARGLEVLVYRGMRAKAVLRCEHGHLVHTYPANFVSRKKWVRCPDGATHRVHSPVGCDACRRVDPDDILFAAEVVGLEAIEDLSARDLSLSPLGRSDSKVAVRCPKCHREWQAGIQNLLHGSGCKCRSRKAGEVRRRQRLRAPKGNPP